MNRLLLPKISAAPFVGTAWEDALLLGTTRYDDRSRILAHLLKAANPDALRYAAIRIAAMLPNDCVLVPMPGHKGYADDTLLLARDIASIRHTEVYDVLQGISRMPNYTAKRLGLSLEPTDFGLRLSASLPEGKTAVLIDNVIDTGVTARAAVNAVGSCVVMAYAMTAHI